MMNYPILVVLLLFATTMGMAQPSSQGGLITAKEKGSNGGVQFGYWEYLPLNYTASQLYPLVIHLHGNGGSGTGMLGSNGLNKTNLIGNSPLARVQAAINPGSFPNATPRHFPAIVVVPQSPTAYFNITSINTFIQDLVDVGYPIDLNRIYVMGISRGGGATWGFAETFPTVPAAIVPICGANVVQPGPTGNALQQLPIWTFHNFGDPIVNRGMTMQNADRITNASPSISANNYLYPYNYVNGQRLAAPTDQTFQYDGTTWSIASGVNPPTNNFAFTLYKRGGHNAWTPAYNDDTMWTWLFAQNKSTNATPIAHAGPDSTITLPVTTITLDGSQSSDSDGNIVAYSWAVISSPATSLSMLNPTTPHPIVNNLTQGTHIFELTITDDQGAVAKDQVSIDVVAPIANGNRIILTPAMLQSATVIANLDKLVNEQPLIGDPAAGQGNAMTLPGQLSLGWGTTYPVSIWVDLGQHYQLQSLWYYDSYNSGTIDVAVGTPSNWTAIGTIQTNSYNQWKKIDLQQGSQYVQLTFNGPQANIAEIALYGSLITAAPPTVDLGADRQIDTANTPLNLTAQLSIPTQEVDQYEWKQLTGPTTLSLNSATATSVTLHQFVAGIYSVELMVADAMGQEGRDTLEIQVTQDAYPANRIVITPDMIINTVSWIGDKSMLIDEWTALGDPKSGIPPSTLNNLSFFKVQSRMYYPLQLIIDLGTDYELTDFWYFAGSGISTFYLYSGTPPHWTKEDSLSTVGWNVWKQAPLNTQTRYLVIELEDPNVNIAEIALYGKPLGVVTTPTPSSTPNTFPLMEEFIGINSLGNDAWPLLENVVGVTREYHATMGNQGLKQNSYVGYPNDAYALSPSEYGDDIDAYYQGLRDRNIRIAPVLLGSPWYVVKHLTGIPEGKRTDAKPVLPGEDPLDINTYRKTSKFVYQYVGRFGSQTLPSSDFSLKSNNQIKSGLGLIEYIETRNEPDKYWTANTPDSARLGYFTPFELATMMSADYDGHEGMLSDNFGGKFGAKTADPNIQFVMPALTFFHQSTDYVRAIDLWAKYNRPSQTFPADILNFHHYSNNGGGQSGTATQGISPEADQLKDKIAQVMTFRDQHFPGKKVWLSEFGYDTNTGSRQEAPRLINNSAFDTKAAWTIRSFMILAAGGIDKAMLYMTRDGQDIDGVGNNINGYPSTYLTSGITTSIGQGRQPKVSYYHVSCMYNTLKGYRFSRELPSNNPQVSIYQFEEDAGDAVVNVIWCNTSSDLKINNFQLTIKNGDVVQMIRPTFGNINGVATTLAPNNNNVSFAISEIPIYIKLTPSTASSPSSEANTKSTESSMQNQGAALKIFPNPTQEAAHVSFLLADDETIQQVVVYNSAGQLVDAVTVELLEQDLYKVHFDKALPTGVYVIQAITTHQTLSGQLILK